LLFASFVYSQNRARLAAAPAGKIGDALVDSVAPIGNDQPRYVKDSSGWKIGGYIGGGDTQ